MPLRVKEGISQTRINIYTQSDSSAPTNFNTYNILTWHKTVMRPETVQCPLECFCFPQFLYCYSV